MTDLPAPTAIRRTVCFSQAILLGEMTVEDVTARRAETSTRRRPCCAQGPDPGAGGPGLHLPRPACGRMPWWTPFWPKRNLGTKIDDAPVVVGIGPGFTAGEDCHAVVETMRGHTLGRVIYGEALCPTPVYRGSSADTPGSGCCGPRRTGYSARSWKLVRWSGLGT